MKHLPKKHGKELTSISSYELESYLSDYKDPDPVFPDFLSDDLDAYKRKLTILEKKTYSVFKSRKESREGPCLQYYSTFRPHVSQLWRKVLNYKRDQFLRSRGVHVDKERETSQGETAFRFVFRKEQIANTSVEEERVVDTAPKDSASYYRPPERSAIPERATYYGARGICMSY